MSLVSSVCLHIPCIFHICGVTSLISYLLTYTQAVAPLREKIRDLEQRCACVFNLQILSELFNMDLVFSYVLQSFSSRCLLRNLSSLSLSQFLSEIPTCEIPVRKRSEKNFGMWQMQKIKQKLWFYITCFCPISCMNSAQTFMIMMNPTGSGDLLTSHSASSWHWHVGSGVSLKLIVVTLLDK